MMRRKLTFALITLVGLLGVLSCAFFVSREDDLASREETSVKKMKKSPSKVKVKVRPRVKTERIGSQDRVASIERLGKARQKPAFDIDEGDEEKLDEEQRRTVTAIQAALDNDDRKMTLRLVQALQKSKEWPDGIPKSIKMAAIEALGWFGHSCLPELAGFLADTDSEVVASAVERFEEMLSDVELSDRERSKILVQASKVIDDSDAMDSMLFELNNMRHSVAIETIKQLMANGGAATQLILADAVEFYTGEEGLNAPEKLDKWLKENPDDEDDEEFYGASKD